MINLDDLPEPRLQNALIYLESLKRLPGRWRVQPGTEQHQIALDLEAAGKVELKDADPVWGIAVVVIGKKYPPKPARKAQR